MAKLFTRRVLTKVVVATLAGVFVAIISWIYLNSNYTLTVEDTLFSNETFYKYQLLKLKPKINKPLVFINTDRDLNLVDDTAGNGNIDVTDRYKLLKLLRAINTPKARPAYTVLDLQFYYPYNYTVDSAIRKKVIDSKLDIFFPDKKVDDSLQAEIKANPGIAVSVLLKKNPKAPSFIQSLLGYGTSLIDTPLYKANYGVVNYKTYISSINKFRIYYPDLKTPSVPCLVYQKTGNVVYSGSEFMTFCNKHLCFNYIWPDYYYDEAGVKSDTTYQEYHLGSLMGLLNSPAALQKIFKGKVVFVGNFSNDTHDTPFGQIPGTIVLADIYLSLLNGNNYVSYTWAMFVIACFSVLGYKAVYGELPWFNFKVKININQRLLSFVKDYLSYITILMLVSLISIIIFGINVCLFLPAFIFSLIESAVSWKQKQKTA